MQTGAKKGALQGTTSEEGNHWPTWQGSKNHRLCGKPPLGWPGCIGIGAKGKKTLKGPKDPLKGAPWKGVIGPDSQL